MKILKYPFFIKTATKKSEWPILKTPKGQLTPEIAIAGRSNVGKSSLLNHLFQSKNLVKTSSVPGKTQALNFFQTGDLVFCDLPGYGYAQVPDSVRKKWGPMVQEYLTQREPLKLIILLIDIRREPTPEDIQMIDWVIQAQKAMILVMTKVDKVSQKEKTDFTKRILEQLNFENIQWVHYSVLKNRGRDELLKKMEEALSEELEP